MQERSPVLARANKARIAREMDMIPISFSKLIHRKIPAEVPAEVPDIVREGDVERHIVRRAYDNFAADVM